MALANAFARICLVAAVLVAAGSSALAQPRLPIGLVNVRRVMTESTDARAAAEELVSLRSRNADDLNARRKAIQSTRLELANAGGFFAASKRATLQQQVRTQEAELEQATQRFQSEMEERQKALDEKIRTEINGVVSALAVERGFLYVLNQESAVILAPLGADITDAVVERLNAAAAKRSSDRK